MMYSENVLELGFRGRISLFGTRIRVIFGKNVFFVTDKKIKLESLTFEARWNCFILRI